MLICSFNTILKNKTKKNSTVTILYILPKHVISITKFRNFKSNFLVSILLEKFKFNNKFQVNSRLSAYNNVGEHKRLGWTF